MTIVSEHLLRWSDEATGLRAVVAIDDTALGPALGGVRARPYPSEAAAAAEVQRLARVMTLKNAAAGLPYGGAKSVILAPTGPELAARRPEVMAAFGRAVGALGGTYLPGIDMGTGVEDLEVMAPYAPGICCVDPSELTALGVFAGIEAALDGSCGGRRVLVQGAGHVGASLAARLAAAGALVGVADVDMERAERVARAVDGLVVDPDKVPGSPCDVLAPCAVARVVGPANVDELQCAIVAGAANDILADRATAQLLADRGVVYVPDFLLNAGGVIAIHALLAGWDHNRQEEAVMAIGPRVRQVLDEARASGRTPLEVGEQLASERLRRPIVAPD